MNPAELTIVIPVYHEQDNIGPVLDGLAAADLPATQVLVVYDDDNDPTVPVVQNWIRH